MSINKSLIGVFIKLILGGSVAVAQEIVTDRPGQSNGSQLVPAGALQIESGFIVEADRPAAMNYTYNTSLIRFGVNANFEGRVTIGYVGTRQLIDDLEINDGFSPVTLGVKIKLADEKGIWPQAAVISNISVNTGSSDFNTSYTAADIALAFSHALNSKFSLTYNAGIKWDGENPNTVLSYTCSFSYALTSKLAAFTEVYGFRPEKRFVDNRLDGGFTYRIASRMQADISGGVGLTKLSPNYFVSAGLSVRFLK
jgi:hypothetical protein